MGWTGVAAIVFTALAVARRAMAVGEVREDGMAGASPLVVYASDQVHNCVDKSVDLLGIGFKHLRKIETAGTLELYVPNAVRNGR